MINTQEVKIPHPRKSHSAARQPVSTSIRHARHTWFCVMMCLATASWGTSALLQTPQTQIHPPAPTPGVPVYLGGGIGSEKIVSAKRKKRARTKRWKKRGLYYLACEEQWAAAEGSTCHEEKVFIFWYRKSIMGSSFRMKCHFSNHW